jgi:hypothetical protein
MEQIKTKSYYINLWLKVCYYYDGFSSYLKQVHGLSLAQYNRLKG